MTATAPGQVIASITGQDLLVELRGLSSQVGEVKQAVAGVSPTLAEHERMINANSASIRRLEQRAAFLAGVGALASLLLGGGVVAAIVTSLHH